MLDRFQDVQLPFERTFNPTFGCATCRIVLHNLDGGQSAPIHLFFLIAIGVLRRRQHHSTECALPKESNTSPFPAVTSRHCRSNKFLMFCCSSSIDCICNRRLLRSWRLWCKLWLARR